MDTQVFLGSVAVPTKVAASTLRTTRVEELLYYLLVAATLAVFIQVYSHDFVNFDDGSYVFANPNVTEGLSLKSVMWAFTTLHGDTSYWHPITWLSHILECHFFGLDPARQHLTNVFLHIANSLLLFRLLRRATGAMWRSFCVAALFAWHPLHVESVAWISERKDVLSTFFTILTLDAYLSFVVRECRRWYWISLFVFTLALMSKPMAVILPVILLLLDFWPLGRIGWRLQMDRTRHEATKPLSLSRVVLEKTPYLALSAAVCIVTILAQKEVGAISTIEQLPISARLDNAVVAYNLYLLKTIWPQELAIFYPHPGRWSPWIVGIALFCMVAMSHAAMRLLHSRPYVIFGWMWYILTLLPTIGIIQVGAQCMADRYTYLPLTGIFVTGCWGLGDLIRRRCILREFAIVGSVLVFVCLIALTNIQLKHWRDTLTLFSHAAEVTDRNSLAVCQVGTELIHRRKYRDAYEVLARGLKDSPNNADLLANAGVALNQIGEAEKAIRHFYQAIAIDPKCLLAYVGLAELFATHHDSKRRNASEAVRLAEQACLLVRPPGVTQLRTLAEAYAEAGRFKEAIETSSHALELAKAFGDYRAAREIHAQQQLFREGKPYRTPPRRDGVAGAKHFEVMDWFRMRSVSCHSQGDSPGTFGSTSGKQDSDQTFRSIIRI